MKKLIFIVFYLSLFLISLECKPQDWLWSKHFGSANADGGFLRVCNNNIYYCSYTPTNDPFYLNDDTLLYFNGNLILSKLDGNGNKIWNKQIKAPLNNNNIYGLYFSISKVDNSIYLSGNYHFSMTSDCGTVFNNAQGGSAIFITKLDSSGNCLWANKIDSTGLEFTVTHALDDSDNLYVAAQHWSPCYYGSNLVSAGTIISKYDKQGNCLWAKNFAYLTSNNVGPQLEIRSMKIKDGFLYINAYENNDTITFDSVSHFHTGKRGALVAKLTLDAHVLWYREGISYSPEVSFDGLGIDDNGNIYTAGAFDDSITFEGNVIYGPHLFGYDDYFVKYDSTGNVQWIKHFHAGNNSRVATRTLDDGNTYVTSGFYDSLNIDNFHLYPSHTMDMYLAKFSSDGNCMGIKHFGDGRGLYIEVDENNDVVVLSQMDSTATLDQNTYSNYGSPYYDIILSKCSAITGIETVEKRRNNELSIYANPNNGKCNITIPDAFKNISSTLTLTIFDNVGKVIHSYPVSLKEGVIKLNIENEAEGMYLVSLTDGQTIYRGKIVFE